MWQLHVAAAFGALAFLLIIADRIKPALARVRGGKRA